MDKQLTLLLILFSVFALLGFAGYFIYKSMKDGVDAGKGFTKNITKQEAFLLIIMSLVIAISEANIASSFTPKGSVSEEFPYVARVVAHIVIALSSWYLIYMFFPKMNNALTLIPWKFWKKEYLENHWKLMQLNKVTVVRAIFLVATPFIYIISGAALPYLNLNLLAIGMEADLQLNLFVYQLTDYFQAVSFSKHVQTIPIKALQYTKLDKSLYEFLPSNYSPWKDSPFELQMMLSTVGLVYLFALLKGLKIVTDGDIEQEVFIVTGAKTEKKSEKSGKDRSRKTDPKETMLGAILTNYDFSNEQDQAQKKTILEAALKTIAEMNEQAKAKIMVKLSMLHTQMEKLDFTNTTDPEVIGWKKDVQMHWSKPAGTGEGLGRTLRAPRSS